MPAQMNLLIDQNDIPDGSMPSLVLVACAKSKCDFPAPAQDLYTSSLFRKSRRFADLLIQSGRADAWRVLSAKHGLLKPWRRIDPYDETLREFDDEKTYWWSRRVTTQLPRHLNAESMPVAPEKIEVTILGGRAYREPLVKLWFDSVYKNTTPNHVHCPFDGMPGNGRMMQWLDEMNSMLNQYKPSSR
jgi:hypothetical protein